MSNVFATGGAIVDGEASKDWVSAQYDDEVYPLGTRRVQSADEVNAANSTHYGDRTWVFIYNDGTALVEGDCVQLDTDYAPFHGIKSAASGLTKGRVLGIAGGALAAEKYGWIIQNGICEVNTDGSVGAGELLTSHTSGQVSEMGSAEEASVFGTAFEGDSDSPAKITAIIYLP